MSTKKTKNTAKLDKLSAMMDKAIESDPHEEAQAAAEPKTPKKKAAKKAATKKAAKPEAQPSAKAVGQGSETPPPVAEVPKAVSQEPAEKRERSTVNLTQKASKAMKRINAFLITDCDAKSVTATNAICVALELAADMLEEKQDEIAALYQEHQMADGRRNNGRISNAE